jgi:SH3-like domain-containing protein
MHRASFRDSFGGNVPFSLQRLPTRGNSGTIARMKMLSANRCLFIATLSLVTATVPLLSIAQEEVTNDAQAVQPPVAQQRFVSDKLVLNVYAEPDQSSARVATIQTGDTVDELERTDNLVRVRLEDGREGWVGANFLVSDAPAAVRLRELEREQKTATRGADKESAEEIARLKKANTALQAQVKELQSSAKAPVAKPAEERPQITATSSAEVAKPDPVPVVTASSGGSSWSAWLVAVVLTGALGFAGGYQTLARRLRRRFGALKIY